MSALFYLDSDNILNRGGTANDNTGDTLRTAALKINTNFQNLDNAINAVANIDTHDSAAVQGQIDATLAVTDTHDSAAVQGQIDATIAATDTHDSAAVLGQINAVNAADVTFGADVTVTTDLAVNANASITNDLTIGGFAKAGLVDLANSNTVTFDLSVGNVARWNRNTSPVDSANTLTLDGTAGGTLDGMGFTIMAFNTDSDRSITFAGGTGITVHYGDSATITWAGADKYTLISGMVFDSANVLILNTSLVGSI